MSELSPEARAIVEAGTKADGPTDADRARLRTRLAASLGAAALSSSAEAGATAAQGAQTAAGTASTGASVAGGGAATVAKTGVALKLAASGALALTLGTGLYVGFRPDSGPPAAGPSSAPKAATSATPSDSAPPSPVPSPAPASATQDSSATKSGEPSSLRQELQLLGAAQRMLQQDKPSRALEFLQRHADRFPRGALKQERTAAHAVALCKLGRFAEGRALSAQLQRGAPDSPLAARVRMTCEP